MKKIYYWGPFIDNKIATVSSIYNSVIGLNKFSNNVNAKIINSIGEWNFKIDKSNESFFVNSNRNIYDKLPKYGFFKSRLSYLIISFFCFFELKRMLVKKNPDFLIAHLIVSLPLLLFKIFNFETKLIIRISGRPKLNFFRKFFWRFTQHNVYKVFCPTTSTRQLLIKNNVFDKKKIYVLNDPIIYVERFREFKKDRSINKIFEKNNIICVGRLTKQKNFNLIIDAYKDSEILKKYKIFIFGEGENKDYLKKKININGLENKIFIMKYEDNIFKYMIRSKLFILTSLWEDPGFVLVESGMCNLNIISSNCPSGPEEIISKEESGGYLFLNNNLNDLKKKIEVFFNEETSELLKKKIFLKKRLKKFTIFNHTTLLKEYLNI